jgi:hypothetical protein
LRPNYSGTNPGIAKFLIKKHIGISMIAKNFSFLRLHKFPSVFLPFAILIEDSFIDAVAMTLLASISFAVDKCSNEKFSES